MINNISWQSYWIFILITIVIYYLIILGLYFSGNGRVVMQGKRKWLPVKDPNSDHEQSFSSKEFSIDVDRNDITTDGNQLLNDELKQTADSLGNEIQAFFSGVANANFSKAKILSSIQTIINKYPLVNGSQYTSNINNLIKISYENTCSIHLKDNEVFGLWNG